MAHKPYEFVPPKPPTWFNLFWPGLLGLVIGFLTATGQKELMLLYAISDLLLNSSTTVNNTIEIITRRVATASMVGLICSLIPENICLGMVLCLTSASCNTTTTSSNEVIKANNAPDTTPR